MEMKSEPIFDIKYLNSKLKKLSKRARVSASRKREIR